MLPDLPGLKNELTEVQRAYMFQVRDAHLGPFSDCPVQPCFEGHRHSILRATGDGEVKEFERIEDSVEIKIGDDLDAVFGKLADMAISFANKMKKISFRTLDKDLAALGRTIDGKGKPWTEQFLEMIASVQFPLNAEGKIDLEGFRIVGGTAMWKKASAEWQELERTPAKMANFLRRKDEILRQKEEEARALEANRKLVG